MRVARILGAVGRSLIGTGTIMLLFVAFQLWGTGLQHARAQDDLAADFDTLLSTTPGIDAATSAIDLASPTGLSETAPDDPVLVESTDPAVNDADVGKVGADFANELTRVNREYVDLLYPSNGEVLGRMEIPRIGLVEFFVEGVGVADLREGPGHYRSTPLPGQAGNAAIAGHRTTYGAPFNRIDELEPGDEILVSTLQGTFTYRVMPQVDGSGETKGYFIVSPSDTQVLSDFGDNRLTLTACHPKYSARQRIIVVAELVEEPTQTLPRPEQLDQIEAQQTAAAELATEDVGADDGIPAGESVPAPQAQIDSDTAAVPATTVVDDIIPDTSADSDFGDGLNGDREAIPAAVTWMIAALALWFTAGFVGRRWRLLPSYAIIMLPFLLLLFVSFIHIDQALPSY